MFNQPIINIGMIGHVSDGKSTLTKSLTGVQTQRYAKEQETNITIRLGYANAKIYKCSKCAPPSCYYSKGSNQTDTFCKNCKMPGQLVNHVSFVDCPGHNSFMGTMMNGTSVMDYTITVESAVNKTFPAPQTVQHLNAIESNSIENIAFILNKIDLVNEDMIYSKLEELDEFKKKYSCSNAPVIPISAAFDINVDVLCEILANLKKPERIMDSDKLRMNIIRSFNINIPGTMIDELKGGVVGGTIIQGTLDIDDEIYIYPGIIYEDSFEPLRAKVLTIFSEKTPLTRAICGGLIGVGLDIDPGLTGDDALVGNIILKTPHLIDAFITSNITLSLTLNNSIEIIFNENEKENEKDNKKDKYILNINTNNVKGNIIKKLDENIFKFELDKPVYIEKNDKITISIKNMNGLQFIGYGVLCECIPYKNVI
jgi:translation initiation factor 2 subunit 3